MTKSDFIERHVLVCSKENPKRPSGRPRGGAKRRCAKQMWATCLLYGVDPERVITGDNLRALTGGKPYAYAVQG